jgi:unsaturated chondroitin disaccharide hydrolase
MVAVPVAAKAAPASVTEDFRRSVGAWRSTGDLAFARGRVRGDMRLVLRGRGAAVRRLGSRWTASLEVALSPGASARLDFGGRSRGVRLARPERGGRVQAGRGKQARAVRWSTNSGGMVRLQAWPTVAGVAFTAGGRRLNLRGRPGRALEVRLERGRAQIDNVVLSQRGSHPSLLAQRLADLQARVKPRAVLVGAEPSDRLRVRRSDWTRGFFAGALWQAAALERGRVFEDWALKRTLANLGRETADTHDLGFMYGLSSLAAERRLCRRSAPPKKLCRRLHLSAKTAADSLLRLAATNARAGTLPIRAPRPDERETDTIVDSLMNLRLLYWATEATGAPRYRQVGALNARRVARLLVREDGSTAQSVHFDRATGAVTRIHTHQGLAAGSTWARGQGWAVYGFTESAGALRDRDLLATAERTARYTADHLPASGVPNYDYAAPGPPDTSAGVITAAGLLRLGQLCDRWRGSCREGSRWRALGLWMLKASLRHVSRSAPLGFLDRQVGTLGGAPWDDRAELVYGLYYALEALRRAR